MCAEYRTPCHGLVSLYSYGALTKNSLKIIFVTNFRKYLAILVGFELLLSMSFELQSLNYRVIYRKPLKEPLEVEFWPISTVESNIRAAID